MALDGMDLDVAHLTSAPYTSTCLAAGMALLSTRCTNISVVMPHVSHPTSLVTREVVTLIHR